MTTKRFLSGALLVVLTACPALAQYTGSPYPAPAQYAGNPYPAPKPYYDIIPSVAPDPAATPDQPPNAMPPGRPAAAFSTALDRVTAPPTSSAPPGVGAVVPAGGEQPSAYTALTGQSLGIPPGSYPGTGWTAAPGATDYAQCCGPVGHDGPIGYETFTETGPSIPFGSGPFVARLEVGWMVAAGGRSLFFNPDRDAAWVTELGWSYEYNRGNQYAGINLDTRAPQGTTSSGIPYNQPDILQAVTVRDIMRNSFNYGIGRDWWFWGPGSTGTEHGWNLRVGALVGGQYGTAHIDLVSTTNPFEYFRRQNVYEGVYIDAHAEVEVPLGMVVLFGGLHLQYVYDWTNLAPPVAGDIQNLNILLSAGFRF